MPFNILLFILLFIFSAHADTNTLQAKKDALFLEYDLVQGSPATYYLIINNATQEVYLKADANLLRTCKILKSFRKGHLQTKKLQLQNHVLPYTPEPRTRLRKRLLPLDFSERLTSGPKHRSRLYFSPSFLIQSSELPIPPNLSGIFLNHQDMKAIASALPLQAPTILVPALTQINGMPQ
jgi:hypothetical protein